MGEQGTAIEWTHVPGYKGETWNPVTGCDRVSPGCAHCYALDLAAKFKGWGQKRYQNDGGPASGPGFGLTLHPDKLEEPLRWRKPRAVFVNSMSDLFHESIPDDYVIETFNTMGKASRHIFMVLTKRPERMAELVEKVYETLGLSLLENVWLGVTIENRRFVDRADLLRQTPAAVRFISAEPLLGPLVHNPFHPQDWRPLSLVGIDWLIVGGESGPVHRRIDKEWVRDLQCASRGESRGPDADEITVPKTAFFFKQWGGRTPKAGGRHLDGRTRDEFPPLPDSPRAA
jgi:protein gp37